MSPVPDDELFIEPASDEDVVYGDYNSTMDGASSSGPRPYIRLTSQLRNATRAAGAEVRFRCEALGTAPINFTWLKNHAPIEKSRRAKVRNRENSSRLVITELDVLDSGYYQCVASNAAGAVNTTSILRVNNVPDSALKRKGNNHHRPVADEYEDYDTMDRGRLPDEEDNEELFRVSDDAAGEGYAPMETSERWLDGIKYRPGLCVPYRGEACRQFLAGRHVMLTADNREDMYDIDRNLRAATMFINQSPSISHDCRQISQAVACYHMYKICDVPSSDGSNVRTICRKDCEEIESKVCPSELALAAQHELVGDGPKALFPKCLALPPTSSNCIPVLDLGKNKMLTPDDVKHKQLTHFCYVESGKTYEGSVSQTESGRQCMPWKHSDSRDFNVDRYPELRYASNFCRNPGGKKTKPWCYSQPSGQEEYCAVQQCPKSMYPHLTEAPPKDQFPLLSLWDGLTPNWQYALVGGGTLLSLLLLFLLCCLCCCRTKQKKSQKASSSRLAPPSTNSMLHHGSAPPSVINSAANSAYYQRKPNGTSTPLLGGGRQLEMAAMMGMPPHGLGVPPPYPDCRPPQTHPVLMEEQQQPYHILEIPQSQLKVMDLIGEGQFGVVHTGLWHGGLVTTDPLQVAVKTVRPDATNAERASLEEEIRTVASFDHPHVIRLLGVCYLDGTKMAAVFEYMVHGDLHDFLRLRAPAPHDSDPDRITSDNDDFMRVATQIAYGMEYLASMQYVHRDLATRNCLVGDQRVIKIADFGLMRACYDNDYYKMLHRSWMPVRWMAKEALEQGRCSEASDVWSFGVTLWEIWNYGRQPYEGYSNQQVIDIIANRHLLECPQNCPTNIYSLMVECWHEHPERRPTFSEIHSRLQQWAMASPAHSILHQQQQQRNSASSHSGSSGAGGVRQPGVGTLQNNKPLASLTRNAAYQSQRAGRRTEDASPLMRREANYAYSEDGDSD